MKKYLTFYPFALLILLTACTEEKDMDQFADLQGTVETTLSYRIYMEPFVGQWNFVSYDILTQTVVSDANGTVCDKIQGRDTRDIAALWTFGADGWGTIAIKKNPTYLPMGETAPDSNISPLVKYGKEFQWAVDNDSTMVLKFYLTDESTETYVARYNWENWSWEELNSASDESPYRDDILSLTVNYTTTGSYDELENTYSGYFTFNQRYDGTGCTFRTDVTLTYYLGRN